MSAFAAPFAAGVSVVLVAALRRIQSAYGEAEASRRTPMTRESWLGLASVLEGQAKSIREFCGDDTLTTTEQGER